MNPSQNDDSDNTRKQKSSQACAIVLKNVPTPAVKTELCESNQISQAAADKSQKSTPNTLPSKCSAAVLIKENRESRSPVKLNTKKSKSYCLIADPSQTLDKKQGYKTFEEKFNEMWVILSSNERTSVIGYICESKDISQAPDNRSQKSIPVKKSATLSTKEDHKFLDPVQLIEFGHYLSLNWNEVIETLNHKIMPVDAIFNIRYMIKNIKDFSKTSLDEPTTMFQTFYLDRVAQLRVVLLQAYEMHEHFTTTLMYRWFSNLLLTCYHVGFQDLVRNVREACQNIDIFITETFYILKDCGNFNTKHKFYLYLDLLISVYESLKNLKKNCDIRSWYQTNHYEMHDNLLIQCIVDKKCKYGLLLAQILEECDKFVLYALNCVEI